MMLNVATRPPRVMTIIPPGPVLPRGATHLLPGDPLDSEGR